MQKITIHVDKKDRLINGQTGNNRHIEFTQGSACKIYIKFLGRQNFWVPIEKCETEIPPKRKDKSIHQRFSITFKISLGIYCSKSSKLTLKARCS